MISTFEDSVAQATRELLEQIATQGAGRCVLMLDPELRPAAGDDLPHYSGMRHTPVPLLHPNIDAASYPRLTPLRLAVEPERELLVHSVREACAEMQPEALRAGLGRRVCGWMLGDVPADTIASHWGRLLLQRHPSGRTLWLRLHDPAVLWVISGWLMPAQLATLLGPLSSMQLLTPAMQLLSLESNDLRQSAELHLTDLQWAAIDLIGPLNTALRNAGDFGPNPLADARRHAFAAIRRAKAMGFDDTADLGLYGQIAIEIHSRFDFHPVIVALLKNRPPGSYFSALIRDLTERDWERIRRESPAAAPATT